MTTDTRPPVTDTGYWTRIPIIGTPRLTRPNLVDELQEFIGRDRANAVVNGDTTNPNAP